MQESSDVSNCVSVKEVISPRRQILAPAVWTMAAAALLLAGCNGKRSADVVATVNGHAIMQADLDKQLQVQLDQAQQRPTKEQADGMRLQVLHDMIDTDMLEQRAAKMNLTATNEEVDAKVAEMKAPFPTEEEFQAKLKASNRTLDEVKRLIRQNLTIDKLLNKEVNSKVTVTDADVANYYNQHKSEFNLIETQYHLAQIQVTSQPSQQPGNLQGSKATNDAEAKKKIQALKNRLDSGEDFGALAANFSENPTTAPNGGDMGFVAESQMHGDPAIFAAITKTNPGHTTDILPLLDAQTKQPAGYVIYKVISRDPPGQRDLNDPRVQQAIRQQLHEVRSQLLKSAYFEIVRDQAKVENYYAEQVFKNEAH